MTTKPTTPLTAGQECLIAFLVALNLTAQLGDGMLTYIGVKGGFPEGNSLLVWLMAEVGVGTGLVVAKLMSAFAIFLLMQARKRAFVLVVYGLTFVAWAAICACWGWVKVLWS